MVASFDAKKAGTHFAIFIWIDFGWIGIKFYKLLVLSRRATKQGQSGRAYRRILCRAKYPSTFGRSDRSTGKMPSGQKNPGLFFHARCGAIALE